jgi:hypothetical protein
MGEAFDAAAAANNGERDPARLRNVGLAGLESKAG